MLTVIPTVCPPLLLQNVGVADNILSDDDDDDEEEFSSADIKRRTRETASLLPPNSQRMDSFEAEIDESDV